MEKIGYLRFFIFLVLTVVFSGCSETIIKYQCQDGSIQDSPTFCPKISCQTDCPEIDCDSCPVKTDTKIETQTITKNVYICPDGTTEVDKKADCTTRFLSDADYELGDQIIAGDFKWKFTKYTTASEIGDYFMDTFMGVKADGEFLIINVEVENVGKTANYLSDSYVKLIDEQNREFSADSMAAIYLKPDGSALSFDNINPGIVKKGKIVFDVPSGLKIAKIRVSSNLVEDIFYDMKLMT